MSLREYHPLARVAALLLAALDPEHPTDVPSIETCALISAVVAVVPAVVEHGKSLSLLISLLKHLSAVGHGCRHRIVHEDMLAGPHALEGELSVGVGGVIMATRSIFPQPIISPNEANIRAQGKSLAAFLWLSGSVSQMAASSNRGLAVIQRGCVPSSGVEVWPFRERQSRPVLILGGHQGLVRPDRVCFVDPVHRRLTEVVTGHDLFIVLFCQQCS